MWRAICGPLVESAEAIAGLAPARFCPNGNCIKLYTTYIETNGGLCVIELRPNCMHDVATMETYARLTQNSPQLTRNLLRPLKGHNK
jgi:hypothetical protein